MAEFFIGMAIVLTALNALVAWIVWPYVGKLRKELKAQEAKGG